MQYKSNIALELDGVTLKTHLSEIRRSHVLNARFIPATRPPDWVM